MILDSLPNASLYAGLGPRFEKAFAYLRDTDLAAIPLGKYELDGEFLFVAVQEYTTNTMGNGKWEAHRRYIDVQYIVQGTERICHAPLNRVEQGEYNAEKDFLALTGQGDFLKLTAGDFAVFFPHDAHMPNMAIDGPSTVRKAVVKIAIG